MLFRGVATVTLLLSSVIFSQGSPVNLNDPFEIETPTIQTPEEPTVNEDETNSQNVGDELNVAAEVSDALDERGADDIGADEVGADDEEVVVVVPNISSEDIVAEDENAENKEIVARGDSAGSEEIVASQDSSENEEIVVPADSVPNIVIVPSEESEDSETVASDSRREERVISRLGSPFTITLVESESARRKRTVNNATSVWTRKIPYIIDSSFKNLGVYFTILLKRAMQFIMDRVCITFVDVTDIFPTSDSTWLMSNGFQTNSYIKIWNSGSCTGEIGPGRSGGARYVSPCTDFWINLHELGHAVGSMHVQESPVRDSYLTLYPDNISPEMRYSYRKFSNISSIISTLFDPRSVLMYSPKTWTPNGLETFSPVRDDFFSTVSDTSKDDVLYYELSQHYKCQETFCNTDPVDCEPGYYTLVKGVCRCVCPEEREETTNCKTLKNGPSTFLKWPKTPMVLFAAGPQHACPAGFTPGWFSFTGKNAMTQTPVRPPVIFPSSGTTTDLPLCVKETPTGSDVDWESWPPGGQYCMVKPANEACGGAFVESKLDIQSFATIRYNGSIGDTTINGANITQRYCCRFQESSTFPTEWPNAEPFRIMSRGTCPKIRGLKAVNTRNNWWSPTYTVTNASTSPWWLFSSSLTTYSCYYSPAIYGCNQDITLDANTRTATVTTPGFATAREANRRCFYNFNVPPGSQVKITFNTFDLSLASDDAFFIKRFHKWQDPYRIDETNYPKEILSEGDYLSIEYWSGLDVTTKKGVSFTASVILPEDLCYDSTQRGADYSGNTYITETYEECLPWSMTVDCDDFPSASALWLLRSEKFCRNPNGALIQPFCYVSRNGTGCQKRYCDVCNLKSTVDILKSCTTLMAADPGFCSTSLNKFGCAKSCAYYPIPSTRGTCGEPPVPSDGTLVSLSKNTYNEGEVVQVKCTASSYDPLSEMKCTNAGWTTLTSACKAGCDDKVQFCQDILRSFPRFCTHTKTKATASQYCAGSCSVCTATTNCATPSDTTFTRTSSADSIKNGQFMSFTCSPGLYFWSGDRDRACGLNGELLGNNLDCQVQPPITDVNINFVRKRLEVLKTNTAYLMDRDEYKIPFKGIITRWYFYCKSTGIVTFAVYRKVNNAFTYVGANNVTCQPDYMQTYYVPTQDQISVQANDVLASHTTVANTLYASDCNGYPDNLLNNQIIAATTFADLAIKPVSGTYCMIPSFAARVQPV